MADPRLHKVTVNLTERSWGALERAATVTQDTKTDVINRALLVYALIHDLGEQDGGQLFIRNTNGTEVQIHVI